MHLRHTHSHIYQQVGCNGRQNDIEIHSSLSYRTAEKSFVGLTKVRQRDEVCGQGSRADEQGEET